MTPRIAILTISDSAVAGTRADKSGPALHDECVAIGWTVSAQSIVPDEAARISDTIATWADTNAADVILTTGGTGVAPRDVTPEATRAILDREIPGIAELLRTKGLEQTKFSILSRAVVGSRKRAFIANFPGSPSGALFSLKTIAYLVPHIINLLHGETAH